jgi:hypothetical protein
MRLYKITVTTIQYAAAETPSDAMALARPRWQRDMVTIPDDAMQAEEATGEPEQGWGAYEPYGHTDATVSEWLAGRGDGGGP